MAKARKVITEDGELIEPIPADDGAPAGGAVAPAPKVAREKLIDVSPEEIDRCIGRHAHVLRNLVIDNSPPADGAILTLINTINALKSLKGGL